MKTLIGSLSVLVLGLALSASAAEDCKGKACCEKAKACCDKAKTAGQADAKGKSSCDAAKSAQAKKSMDLSEKGGKRLLSSI